MSDPKDTGTSETPVTPPAAAPAPAPAPLKEEAEPHWLSARLERERTATLKKMGFETVEEAQASATELKAKRDAEKTSADKAAEALTRAKKAESKEKALTEAVAEFAARQMVGLTDEQKAAVNVIAGEDPAQQLKAIAALQPTWAKAEVAKPAPKAVDTAPAANAPAPTQVSETNHKAQYESLRKTNPFAAAAYGVAHSNEVFGT